jgi:enamine deaminase RidA (YjgF/YER057c/UK114 family)
MDIERSDGPERPAYYPIISLATAHAGTVYVCGVTADPDGKLGDVQAQTRETLARIDALLAKMGTNKSRLISAQVWLTDMDLFAAHNEVWNEWVDRNAQPTPRR